MKIFFLSVYNTLILNVNSCAQLNVLIWWVKPYFKVTGHQLNHVGEPEKRSSVKFTTSKAKFCLRLHYNDNESYLHIRFVNLRFFIIYQRTVFD